MAAIEFGGDYHFAIVVGFRDTLPWCSIIPTVSATTGEDHLSILLENTDWCSYTDRESKTFPDGLMITAEMRRAPPLPVENGLFILDVRHTQLIQWSVLPPCETIDNSVSRKALEETLPGLVNSR